MNNEELITKIAKFSQSSLKEYKDRFKELDKKRKSFVNDFPLSRIKKMTLDEYVEGKQNKFSFCNRLERELDSLGSMRSGYATKFGIYFSKNKNKYIFFKKKYGNTLNKAFNKIINDIVDLIEDGKTKRITALIENETPAMLKGKILSTYYPNKYLNVFSEKYLRHYISELNLDMEIENPNKISLVEMRDVLLRFKNSNSYMKKWSIYEFSNFLHHDIGHPDNANLPSGLDDYVEIDFPLLSDTKPKAIILSINKLPVEKEKNNENSNGTKKFPKKHKRNAKRIGDRGEDIVIKYEISKLKDAGKHSLSNKVKKVSEESDSYGYDVRSFELGGIEKQIEVKSTVSSPGQSQFVISESELVKSKILPNYYLYIVFDVNKKEPKIWELKNPFVKFKNAIKITPKSYYVYINSSVN
jgi:hypothetical protein